MPHITLSSLEAAPVGRYRAVLCDLDGCLISGGTVLPGARALFRQASDRLWIVSNNSSDTAQTLSVRLTALGLPVPAGRILLAGEHAVRQLSCRKPGAGLLCLADEPLRNLAAETGLRLVRADADLVLLARMAAFSLKTLEEAAAALGNGAELWVTNTDRTHPAASGLPVPETGALLAALLACVPDADFKSFGKPAPDLLIEALRLAGAQPDETVFIGDNPATDGEAAAGIGMDFIEIDRFSDSTDNVMGVAEEAEGVAAC